MQYNGGGGGSGMYSHQSYGGGAGLDSAPQQQQQQRHNAAAAALLTSAAQHHLSHSQQHYGPPYHQQPVGSPVPQQQQQQQQQHGSSATGTSNVKASDQQQQQTKSRSVMACVLCRRQKMKCEGPDKAPCKRCRAAGVDCTFEAPPTTAPRPRPAPVTESYIESRFTAVEERLSNLEATTSLTPARELGARSSSSAPSSSILAPAVLPGPSAADQERRIVSLESQVYALSLSSQAQQQHAQAQAQAHAHQQHHQRHHSTPQPVSSAPASSSASTSSASLYGTLHPQYSTQDFALYSHAHPSGSATNLPSMAATPFDSGSAWFDSSASASPFQHLPTSTTMHGVKADSPHARGYLQGGSNDYPARQQQQQQQPAHQQRGNKRRKSLHCAGGDYAEEDRSTSPASYRHFSSTPGAPPRTAAASDFISRGLVTEEEASLCFESYFLTFAHPSATPSNMQDPSELLDHDNVKPLNGIQRPIRLPFNATRARSPLLLATLISIGARSLNRFETYKTTLAEAIRLCHGTFLTSPGTEPTSLDLKGIMLLSLYNGMPDLMSHGITLSWKFGMPTALLEYERLSEDDRKGKKGLVLLRRGRTFFVSFLWTSFYSYCCGQHGFYHIPSNVIRHQLDILEGSEFSQQPSDRGIRVNVEENLILRDVFDRLGPGMRLTRPSYDELYEMVEEGIRELLEWNTKWRDMMEMITQWGDSSEIKTAVPYHHGRQSLLMYIFRDMVVDDTARQYPKMREFAKMGSESALVILRWGVESRIWLPHSMVAQYLHHVNLPTAVSLLYTCTRLFPQDANMLLIRNLLHRLLKQCDVCIAGNNGTEHEVVRAHETKRVVLEFDRFAFAFEEASASASVTADAGAGTGAGRNGDGRDAMDGGAGSGPGPGPVVKGISSSTTTMPASSSSMTNGVKSEEETGLFGEEITASLGAMGLELNLWGGILEGALED